MRQHAAPTNTCDHGIVITLALERASEGGCGLLSLRTSSARRAVAQSARLESTDSWSSCRSCCWPCRRQVRLQPVGHIGLATAAGDTPAVTAAPIAVGKARLTRVASTATRRGSRNTERTRDDPRQDPYWVVDRRNHPPLVSTNRRADNYRRGRAKTNPSTFAPFKLFNGRNTPRNTITRRSPSA